MPKKTSQSPFAVPRAYRLALKALLCLFLVSWLPIILFRWVNPPFTSLMLQRKIVAVLHGEEETTLHHEWVPYEKISPKMSLAVVAQEDQKFPHHFGFDLKQIRKALEGSENGKRLRGASTITQQVAKNLLLWPGRSWLRKGLEAYFTALMELSWEKKRILEVYLNTAELGERIFGVEAASKIYFGRPSKDLTYEQAALLAAVLPNPLAYSVKKPSSYLKRRKAWVLRQMKALGGERYLDDL